MYKMSYVGCINRQLRKFTTDQIRADDNTEKSGAIWSHLSPRSPEIQRDPNNEIQTLYLYCSCNLPLCATQWIYFSRIFTESMLWPAALTQINLLQQRNSQWEY